MCHHPDLNMIELGMLQTPGTPDPVMIELGGVPNPSTLGLMSTRLRRD